MIAICIGRVRKVKCDEAKPACARCVSSGRACDGYATNIVIYQNCNVVVPQDRAKKHSDCRGRQESKSALPRQLAANISGTDLERRFFHTFRLATEGGVALHILNVSQFWVELAPKLGHRDEAIKHAVVALGATYQLYKATNWGSRSVAVHQHEMSELEIFIIQQYNKAIRQLQSHITSCAPESTTVALMCCLVFICLENLRFNHSGAIAHLRNGVRIIETSIDLQYLYSPSSQQSWGKSYRTLSPIMSNAELLGIVNYFRYTELCERLFSYDVPLILASRLYANSRFDDGSTTLPREFTCLAAAHEARTKLSNDVMARDWETRIHRGDEAFWSTPTIRGEQECIFNRALHLSEKYKAFMASPYAPKPATREYTSGCLDMLHIKCNQAMIEMMPLRSDDHHILGKIPFFKETLIGGMIHYAELVHDANNASAQSRRYSLDFTMETGIVAPMYFAYVSSTDPDYKARALKILSGINAREGPWDARSLLKLIKMSSGLNGTEEPPGNAPGVLRRWGGNEDCYGLFSKFEITEW